MYLIPMFANGDSFFVLEFQMPDTFHSWFLVTELHVWMLMVRTMAEGEEGRFIRNNIVEAMWQDISTRAKKLQVCFQNVIHPLYIFISLPICISVTA
jgi:cytochrome b pre-mRNA-processing protein 3